MHPRLIEIDQDHSRWWILESLWPSASAERPVYLPVQAKSHTVFSVSGVNSVLLFPLGSLPNHNHSGSTLEQCACRMNQPLCAHNLLLCLENKLIVAPSLFPIGRFASKMISVDPTTTTRQWHLHVYGLFSMSRSMSRCRLFGKMD